MMRALVLHVANTSPRQAASGSGARDADGDSEGNSPTVWVLTMRATPSEGSAHHRPARAISQSAEPSNRGVDGGIGRTAGWRTSAVPSLRNSMMVLVRPTPIWR